MSPRHDALLDEITSLEVIVTDSVMEALALENNLIKQRISKVQHPPPRRQKLSLPAADDERGVSQAAGGAERGREGRRLLRRTVPAGEAWPAHDGAVAPAVRPAVVQRGHHRPPRPALPRIRHQALHRAVRRGDLHRGALRRGGGEHAAAARGAHRGTGRDAARADGGGGRGRAVRGGGPAARRAAHRADAGRAPAEAGHAADLGSRRLRPEGGAERRRDPGVRDARRPRGRAGRAGDRGRRRWPAATPT